MGLFGFACGRCWNYNCSCTPKELEEYNEKCTNSNKKDIKLKVSKTVPEVSPGDIVIKDSKTYYIKDIINGIPIGDVITNNSSEINFDVKIQEPYKKIVGNT